MRRFSQDIVADYLSQIRRIPLLDSAEETYLSNQIKAGLSERGKELSEQDLPIICQGDRAKCKLGQRPDADR
jgi:hypothetical protein